ncbi:MAG: hypothetical protein JWP01_268 [Myxococcales bacterium]|nr:hypothetical protein [Myxococcales bacterium]
MIGEALATTIATADRTVLDRIRGPIGDAARAAFDRLAGQTAEQRREQRITWCAAARAPVPPGIRGVDPSWIEAALADLPARARDAVAEGASTAVDVWLARWACAEIPPMPSIDPLLIRPRTIVDLPRLAAPALQAWLEDVGADQLAFALGPHAPPAAAVFGDRVLAAVARVSSPPRAGSLGQRRAAIERARVEPGPGALAIIGARAMAPHTDPVLRRQLVLRLPRAIGIGLARELRSHARAPVEHTATSAALFAS